MVEAIRTGRWILLGLAVALGGCAGLRNGPDTLITTRNNSYLAVRDTIKDAIISDCLNVSAPIDTTQNQEQRRNRLVSAYMFAVDVAYNEYERNLLDSIRQNDLGAATASLALSSIGSVVQLENLARALDVANTIVTGTHTAIGRDYLLNQTLTTLQTQMRASRTTQRALILRRLSLSFAQWDSCMAVSDVLAFEQAGTLNAAIAAVAASAAQANNVAQQQVQRAIPVADLSTGVLADELRAYLESDPNRTDARVTTALTAMGTAGVGPQGNMSPYARLQQLVSNQLFAAERQELVAAIIEAERGSDPEAARRLQAALDRERGGN